jgi:transposase InsO family protein
MAEQREQYPLEAMCKVLEVTRGGYYAHKKRQARGPSPQARRRQELAEKIRQVHQQSHQTYGSPRVCRELAARGEKVCENTVAKVMKDHGIRSVVRRKFCVKTTDSNHAHPVAGNLLQRNFQQEQPDRVWAADITYIPTAEGWLYLASVIDLCTRKIVGWAMADHLRADLCIEALEMAIQRRRPGEGLIHHSDRGIQYACRAYRELLEKHGIQCSMSGKGDCYDNAVIESFFKTLKTELVYQQDYATRAAAMASIFGYIEIFYNRRRRHSSLGYKSPEEFERCLG